MKRVTTVVAAAALIGSALSATTAQADPAGTPNPGRHTYQGTIDGAKYKVEMPERWNGTLLVYSHPYYPPGMPDFPPGYGNRVDSESYFLEQGYALAASDFKGRTGFVAKDAVQDQIGVLDWFERHIGKPRRTVATGSSGGGAISILLAEKHPSRVDGVVAMCAPIDLYGQLNSRWTSTSRSRRCSLPATTTSNWSTRRTRRQHQRLQQVLTEKVETRGGGRGSRWRVRSAT